MQADVCSRISFEFTLTLGRFGGYDNTEVAQQAALGC